MRMTATIIAGILPLSVASAALAQGKGKATAQLEEFATLDRTGIGTGVGASLSFVLPDGDDNVYFSRTELYGQFMTKGGWGGYLSLPISRAHVDDGNDVSTVGNLEVGGAYLYSLGRNTNLAFRAGLGLPTAGDGVDNVITNGIASYARLTDFNAAIPDTTTLRLAVSPTWRKGNLFARADLGIDMFVVSNDNPLDGLVRMNVGAGTHITPKIAVSGELVTLGSIGDVADDDERFVHTAAVSARFNVASVQPHLTFSVPLDDDARGDLWMISTGLSSRF